MYLCYMNIADYINRGYRVYRLEDFNLSLLSSKLPILQRQYRIEVEVRDKLVMVRDTSKYDLPKNPYINGNIR